MVRATISHNLAQNPLYPAWLRQSYAPNDGDKKVSLCRNETFLLAQYPGMSQSDVLSVLSDMTGGIDDVWVIEVGRYAARTTKNHRLLSTFFYRTWNDSVATIRSVYQKYGQMIDTHTVDGVKVGLEYREAGVPLICLETALPAKFEETIREALGREPERPADLKGLEDLPQRVEVVDVDVDAVKRYIVANS